MDEPNENQTDAPAPEQAQAITAPVKKRKHKKRKKIKPEEKEIKLNTKNMEFVREYLSCGNATKSYMRVYPRSSEGAAAVSAHDLLNKPKIKAYLQKHYDRLWERNEEQIGRSFNRLLKIIESDISDVVEYEGGAMTIRNFSEIDTSIIQSVSHTVSPTKYGVAENKSVKLYDKVRLMPELFRMLGMVKDKMEHSGVIRVIPAAEPEDVPDDYEEKENPPEEIEDNGDQGS